MVIALMTRLFHFAGAIVCSVCLTLAASTVLLAQTGEISPSVVPSLGHNGMISGLAASPDGRWIVSASSDNTLKIWDARDKHLVRTLVGHTSQVSSVAISPDGRWIASGGGDKQVRIWELQSGALLRSLAAAGWVYSVAFSPDGSQVAAGQTGLVQTWRRDSGDLLKSLQRTYVFLRNRPPLKSTESVKALVFSASGRQIIASYDDGTFLDWNIDSGKITNTSKFEQKNFVTAAALSADGQQALISNYQDFSIKLVSVRTGQLVRSYGEHGSDIETLSFSDDASLVASTDRAGQLKVWRTANGQTIRTIDGYSTLGASMFYRGNGTVVFGGFPKGPDGNSTGTSSVVIAGLNGATAPVELNDKVSYFGSIKFLPDGMRYVTFGDAIRIWSVASGEVLRTVALSEPVNLGDVSADGRLVAVVGAAATFVLDLETGKTLQTFRGKGVMEGEATFSPDGKMLACITHTANDPAANKVNVWDISTGQLLYTLTDPSKYVFSAAFSPDSSRIATASNIIHIWNARTGALERKIAIAPILSALTVRFAPDGKSLAADIPGKAIRIWDSQTGQPIKTLTGHEFDVQALAYSPDGLSMASSDYSGAIRIWNLRSGTTARILRGHATSPRYLSFSRDGQRLISNSDENTLIIWSTARGELLTRSIVGKQGQWVTISPEGFFTSSGPAGDLLQVVRGLEVYSIDQVYQALYRPDLVRESLAGDPKGLVREAAARLDLNKVIASGAAPHVSILTQAGNVGSDDATVEAEIAEQNGGGIGRIEWRVNGVTLGVESRGVQRLPDAAAGAASASRPPVVVKRTLALEPGENRIEVVAYNGRDLIASSPAQVVLKWDGEKSATPPKLHVLAVGVNDYYDSRLKLSYAVPDARALGDALKQAGGALYQSVDVTSVFDDKVTVDNLDRVFADLGGKVHPRDVFVFFLAGHGKTVDGRYHFLPQNFRYEDENSIVTRGIDQERFQAWFAKIPARKSILLYDTCESGSLTGERVQQRGIERVAALEKMTRAMGRTVLSASSDDAPALEGYKGHGVFTYALLDGLAAADTNGNGLIEVTELAAFVDQKVPELSYQAFKMRQIPQMKIVGNSFAVVSKASVLQSSDTAASSDAVPTRPTHVVSPSAIDVHVAAARGGAVVQQLQPGTAVTLIEGANGWQLIAKDGKKLGFVEERGLLKLQ